MRILHYDLRINLKIWKTVAHKFRQMQHIFDVQLGNYHVRLDSLFHLCNKKTLQCNSLTHLFSDFDIFVIVCWMATRLHCKYFSQSCTRRCIVRFIQVYNILDTLRFLTGTLVTQVTCTYSYIFCCKIYLYNSGND